MRMLISKELLHGICDDDNAHNNNFCYKTTLLSNIGASV